MRTTSTLSITLSDSKLIRRKLTANTANSYYSSIGRVFEEVSAYGELSECCFEGQP